MLKNFQCMPKMLKWLTAFSAAQASVAAALSVTSGSIVTSTGLLAAPRYWASGVGVCVLTYGGLFGLSCFQMMRRSSVARRTHLYAWLAATSSIPLIGAVLRHDPKAVLQVLTINGIAAAAVAAYLYKSRSVKAYFGVPDPEKRTME